MPRSTSHLGFLGGEHPPNPCSYAYSRLCFLVTGGQGREFHPLQPYISQAIVTGCLHQLNLVLLRLYALGLVTGGGEPVCRLLSSSGFIYDWANPTASPVNRAKRLEYFRLQSDSFSVFRLDRGHLLALRRHWDARGWGYRVLPKTSALYPLAIARHQSPTSHRRKLVEMWGVTPERLTNVGIVSVSTSEDFRFCFHQHANNPYRTHARL